MNFPGLEERIRAFGSQHREGVPVDVVQPVVEPQVIPRGMPINQMQYDPLQEKIDRSLQAPPMVIPIHERFSKVPDITANLHTVTTEFRDDKFLNESSVLFKRYNDRVIAYLGRMIMPMFSIGFSSRGVGALFLIAYHLKDPARDGSYSLPTPAEAQAEEITDVDYELLPNTLMNSGQILEPLPATDDPSEEASAYSFFAAAALRLFTKSEDNFIKAFSHILSGYSRFYGTRFPVTIPPPTIEGLKTLTHWFSQNLLFRHTLFRFLYLSGSNDKSAGMKRFLYEIHLANTGIHVVSIFVKLTGILNCTPALLLTMINIREFERQVSALVAMLDLITNTDDGHLRKMWRYGRLFDETFMVSLQTKSCPSLTYILASALKSESAKANENILNIAQLADLSTEMRRRCDTAGKIIVRNIRASHSAGTPQESLRILYE